MKLIPRIRVFGLALLSALLLGLYGCDDEKVLPECNLQYCPNGLFVAVEGNLPQPSFEIRIVELGAPGFVGEKRVYGPYEGHENPSFISLDLQEFFPETVRVGVYWDDDSLVIESNPAYETEYPNGPNCGACTSAGIGIQM